jgi:hypothetical protein
MKRVSNIAFEDFPDPLSIQYRLHPSDVGFDLREQNMTVVVADADEISASYPAEDDTRRVITGPIRPVLRILRGLGFKFRVERLTSRRESTILS